jgi:hypothetical protein
MAAHQSLPESDIYHLFSNFRRREVMTILWGNPAQISLRELSELIAEAEADQSPAPRPLRESVYNALHRTHLPKLDECGLVRYDPDRKHVRPVPESRRYRRYMDVDSPIGLSWGEYYRGLGIVGLVATVASLAEVTPLDGVDPLIYSSGTLGIFAFSTLYQLVKSPRRRSVREYLFGD